MYVFIRQKKPPSEDEGLKNGELTSLFLLQTYVKMLVILKIL